MAQIAYWQNVRAQQIESGQAGDYSTETIHPGDLVQCSGDWHKVLKANKKTVTVPHPMLPQTWTDRVE